MELSDYFPHFPDVAAVSWPLETIIMMFLHCLMGLVAARIAYQKGADLGQWLVLGIAGGTPALIVAMAMQAAADSNTVQWDVNDVPGQARR